MDNTQRRQVSVGESGTTFPPNHSCRNCRALLGSNRGGITIAGAGASVVNEARGRMGTALIRVGMGIRAGMGSIAAGIAVVAVGFSLKGEATPAGAAVARLKVERASLAVFGTNRPENYDLRHPVRSEIPARPGVRLASLETEVDAAPRSEAAQSDAPNSTTPPSFDERFSAFFDRQPGEAHDTVVFGAPVLPMPLSRGPQAPPVGTSALPSRMHAVRLPPARPAGSQPAPETAAVTQPSPAAASQKPVRTADVGDDSASPPGPVNRTAIYDISAKVVYLPNGDKLEAHSGLGANLDDPRSISLKDRGVTPPNVYDLTLRKQLFHGVQAIRLIPADEGKMFGRDGILAHSYMLGPNGQSNGCVSFSNYSAFLNAFLKGEIDRLVVVEHYAGAPGPTGLGWLMESVRSFFKSS